MSERLVSAAVGYWRWNARAFQAVKANVGYWIAALCAAIEVGLWVR